MKHAGRRDRLRAVLPAGAAAMIVTSASNVRYLSGFTGSNGALLIAADPVHDRLGTDFRYVTQSVAQCPDLELVVARAVLPQLVDHAEELRLGPLAFEAEHVSVAAHAALLGVHPRLPLLASSGLVEALRVVKDDSELALLARACRISDAALADLTPTVQVGQTEREIARRLEALMLDHGAEAISFDTIVAGGANSAVPHHRPTDRPLARGDLLKIDFGALYEGYHADETRTFVVGAPPQGWQQDLHALVATAQQVGVDALAPGAETGAVDDAARSVIVAAGHGEQFGHGLGHGVGLDIHEAPMLGPTAPAGILADRTPVTVEPGVYLPGRGGVRIEDTLVVRPGGRESLTRASRDLLVLGT